MGERKQADRKEEEKTDVLAGRQEGRQGRLASRHEHGPMQGGAALQGRLMMLDCSPWPGCRLGLG